MRHILIVVVALTTLFSVSAQQPWSDYDARQQHRVLNSRKVSGVVRSAYSSLDELDDQQREELLDIVTSPVKNRAIQSLYIYVYEMLRPADGTAALYDAAILRLYPEYMLRRWKDAGVESDIINYAYALGRYSAMGGQEADAAVDLSLKRRYKRHYADQVVTLCSGMRFAAISELYGGQVDIDYTAYEPLILTPYDISKGRYDDVVATVSPFVPCELSDDVERAVAVESIAWSGSYNMPHSTLTDVGLNLVYCYGESDNVVVITADDGFSSALPAWLYLMPTGEIYALSVDDDNRIDGVVVGRIGYAEVDVMGIIPIEHGVLRDVKCCAEGLYLRVEDDMSDRYMFIPAAEL